MKSHAISRTVAMAALVSLSVSLNTVIASEADNGAGAAVIDKDHDGVPDSRDKCPNTAQLRKVDPESRYAVVYNAERRSSKPMSVPVDAEGCDRDTDGYGVVDHKDYCPDNAPEELSSGVAFNGCPKHSDKDGTPDYRDKCPDTPYGVKTDRYGCSV